MTKIGLAKNLTNIWCLQLNKKQAIEIFDGKDKQKQKPFPNAHSESPSRIFWKATFKILPRQEIWEIKTKNIFHRNCHPATERSSGFQGKNKQKAKPVQHAFSTYNSFGQYKECSSIDKKLVLCRNLFIYFHFILSWQNIFEFKYN